MIMVPLSESLDRVDSISVKQKIRLSIKFLRHKKPLSAIAS